jgi:hypothetical protein
MLCVSNLNPAEAAFVSQIKYLSLESDTHKLLVLQSFEVMFLFLMGMRNNSKGFETVTTSLQLLLSNP